MFIKRKCLEKLEQWLKDEYRKPLVVYGARQVGKTTLLRDIFAKEYFKTTIYIDFKVDKEERVFIKNHVNAKDIVDYLSRKNNVNIDENTLIIFDEIQECLPCLTSLKYFCQDYRHVPVIATGSMIRIKLKQIEYEERRIVLDKEIDKDHQDGNNNYLFPTGKINKLNMFPISFEEYLQAKNDIFYNFLFDSYKKKEVLDDEYHNLAMSYLYEYLSIGGMPEVVDIFLKTKSFNKARNTLEEIYSDYLADMSLYQISQETIMRTRNVFNNIYLQLNKDNKNFKISFIEANKRVRDYLYPLDWLSEGNIVFKSYCLKEIVHAPLSISDSSLFRIYFSDIGFFSYQSGLSGDKFLYDISRNDLAGIFFENFVACQLSYRNQPLFYWKGKTSSELEFLIDIDSSIIPIDAKKNKGTLDSIEKYREHNKNDLAIKVSNNKYGYNNDKKLLTLPFYYFGFYLEEHLKQF